MKNKHNLSGTKLYDIWKSMNRRCADLTSEPAYSDINVFGIWRTDVLEFYKYCYKTFPDLDLMLESGYQLDRVNTLEGYFPGNIRFTQAKYNLRNRKTSRYFKFKDGYISIGGFFDFLLELNPFILKSDLVMIGQTMVRFKDFENLEDIIKSNKIDLVYDLSVAKPGGGK